MTAINFTIDLVSNGSTDIFPENTLSKFQNQIDPALELDGDWEVALTEIYFPIKFAIDISEKMQVNFNILYTAFTFYPNIDLRVIYPPEQKWRKYDTLGGDYESSVDIFPDDSVNAIIDKLNTSMMANLKSIAPTLVFDSYPKFVCENGKTIFYPGLLTTKKDKATALNVRLNGPVDEIKAKYKKDHDIDLEEIGKLPTEAGGVNKAFKHYKNIFIDGMHTYSAADGEETEKYKEIASTVFVPQFSDGKLMEYLGFSPSADALIDNIDHFKQEVVVTTPLYHKNNVNLMYVYTDIIRDHAVGGTKAPVLRAVPLTTGIYQGIGYCTFEHRIYYPVRKNHIENIAIFCLDDTGEQIKFANIGRVFVSLDFRKKN
ncbi:uncharacterized protein LOC107368650 [Tetranychus urticae]|nr:uncharacterized protein LOC107368650 [Tetranychus urticae]